jgi:protein-S-isoprenylcysteine O-methyltransferase Ste14
MDGETFFRVALILLFTWLMLLRRAYNRLGQSGCEKPEARTPFEPGWLWRVRNGAYLVFLGTVLAYQFGLVWPVPGFTEPHLGLWPSLRWVAVGLMLLALGWLHAVHAHLGRQHAPGLRVRADHELITSGPYAWVRHPMYTGLFCFFLAAGVVADNLILTGAAAANVASISLRIRHEESMLREAFGEAYRAYEQRTGLLWPRLRVVRGDQENPRSAGDGLEISR